jgi:hypothetical protein
MPAIVHGPGRYTIAPGGVLIITTTWPHVPGTSGPNHGPVFALADPDSGQRVEVKLITYDYSKCRQAPTGGGGPGSTEVFYQYKVRSESTDAVTFTMEYYDPK